MSPLLTISSLARHFGSLAALDGVDLRLPVGARHAVIGPNGAGKTTLLNLVAGTIPPTAGRITIAGHDVTTAGAARRARLGVARTFQTPALCDSLSALDNVALGGWCHATGSWPRSRQRRVVVHATHLLDLLDLAKVAHQPAGTLSHGQRRLLEIATALAARPRLLLLDEPAAGLTAADLPALLGGLHRLPASIAVIVVEHHMDVVTAVADTVTVLDHGRVLTSGSPGQVMADEAVTRIYLGAGDCREAG